MRTRIIYIALIALSIAGCVKEPILSEPEGIVLTLSIDDPQTKTTRDGISDFNENVISNTIDVFFYNETTGAITKEAIGVRRNGNRVTIETNVNDIENIFGTTAQGATRGLFVVVNFTGTYEGTSGSRTITDIKNSLLQPPTWSETVGTTLRFKQQSSFVMTGEKQVRLGNAQGSTPVDDIVNLSRVAAKVTFEVTVAENTSGESGVWTPDTGNMSVYMVYPMRKATLGAEPVSMPANANVTFGSNQTVVNSQSYETVLYPTGENKTRTRRDGENTVQVSSPLYTTLQTEESSLVLPFYTYPETWVSGSSMEPYMKLIIPWTYNNSTKKYYYKIPFHGNALERNHWYHISIDVQILGTEQADPPEVTVTYAIAGWSGTMDTTQQGDFTSQTSLPATVISARYLNVPTTEYVMYNENAITIPIQSSHDVEVVGFDVASGAYTSTHDVDANYVGDNPRIYNPFSTTLNSNNKIVAARPDYSSTTPSAVTHEFTYNQATDAQGWSVTVNGRESVTLTHALNRDLTLDDYDVAPYTIRLRLRHVGDGADKYFTDVTIEQKPSIIIKPERNSDNGSILSSNNNNRGVGHTTEDGYVFNNGVRSNTDQSANRRNTNFNMYIIETSILPTEGSLASYMLGDPRSKTTEEIADTYASGKDIVSGEERSLENYYPAGTSTDFDNFIAPKFRIASSFGASPAMSRTDAIKHCATYQEDGYPAGRWRLPTVAEIAYMARLTRDGLIPRLLGTDNDNNTTGYWCNSGYVAVADGTNTADPEPHTPYTSGTYNVRCVYDEWFWEDTTYEKASDKTEYTWGDQLRSNVRKK